MSGYQSDTNLQDLTFVGDFPVEHSIGGYGETNGETDAYDLTLTPQISQYRVGMHLQVKFNHPNAGAATLNVDSKGAISMMKIEGDTLVQLQANELNTTAIYNLIYDGTYFQVVSTLPSQILPASETVAGIAELATNAEAHAGTDNTRVITPLKLHNVINSLIASETELGLSIVATQAEVNAGSDDIKIVTPLKLITLLDLRNASETQRGFAELATQAEVAAGSDDSRIVTPLKLAAKLATELTAKENALGNPFFDGWVLQSTAAGVRSWRATNRRLFTSYGTFGGGAGTGENDFGSTYTMPAGTLSGNESLEINISGDIQGGAGDKTLRVYIGNEEVFTYTTNVVGHWSIRILGGRFTTNIFKGEVSMIHTGVTSTAQVVQTAGLNMDTTDQLIRITHQNAIDGFAQLNRYSFLIRHLI